MNHDADQLNMALQANSASAPAKGRSRIAIFATVQEAETAVIDDAAALVDIAAWDELALRVPWGVQPARYARVANGGPVFGGQFLSNGGTVRWQITGTDFYLVQFGSGSDHYAAALINVESFFANTSGSGRLFFPPHQCPVPSNGLLSGQGVSHRGELNGHNPQAESRSGL